MSDVVLCGLCGAEQRQDVAVLCLPCGTTLHGDLRAVRSLLGMLRDSAARLARIDRGTPGSDDDVRRTLDTRYPLTAAASPSPVDFGASDTARRLRAAVTAWALRLLDDTAPSCGHPTCVAHLGPRCAAGDARAEAHARLDDAALWLADRWTLIRRAAWGPACATDIRRAMAAGWALVDSPPETWFAGYCDAELVDPDRPGEVAQCGWTLSARLVDDVVRCRGCGTQHDVVERRRRMLDTVGEVRVTAADAARALSTPTRPVTSSMVYGWKRLGHLVPAVDVDEQGGQRPAVDDRGRPLYRLADVIAADNRVRYGTASTGRAS